MKSLNGNKSGELTEMTKNNSFSGGISKFNPPLNKSSESIGGFTEGKSMKTITKKEALKILRQVAKNRRGWLSVESIARDIKYLRKIDLSLMSEPEFFYRANIYNL